MEALLALLSSACWGTADFIGGSVSRRVHPLAAIGLAQAIVFPLTAGIVLSLGAQNDPSGWLPWAVATGLANLAALVAFYEALARGTMGVVAPIAGLGVVLPVFIGLFRGERPGAVQVAGMAMAVVGVVLAGGPEVRTLKSKETYGDPRSVLLALFAACGFGFVFWGTAMGSYYSAGMTLLSTRVVIIAAVLLIGAATRRSGRVRRRDVLPLAIIGLLEALANGSYSLATRMGPVSVVAVFASLYPITTLILARLRHGERLQQVQLTGVGCVMLGIVMLAAG